MAVYMKQSGTSDRDVLFAHYVMLSNPTPRGRFTFVKPGTTLADLGWRSLDRIDAALAELEGMGWISRGKGPNPFTRKDKHHLSEQDALDGCYLHVPSAGMVQEYITLKDLDQFFVECHEEEEPNEKVATVPWTALGPVLFKEWAVLRTRRSEGRHTREDEWRESELNELLRKDLDYMWEHGTLDRNIEQACREAEHTPSPF